MVKKRILGFFSFLIIALFMISFVSAAEFDNTYEYFEEDKTAVIHNCDLWIGWCWNEGEELARLELTWGDTTVHRGIDVHVGTFNLTILTENDSEVFDALDLTNLKNGQTMTRGKKYKAKTYKTEDKYITECIEQQHANGTSYQDCVQVENGTKLVPEWIPISNPNFNFIKDVEYEIGVFVDVEKGDGRKNKPDWVPSLYGVEIEEWSEWTESLNSGLVAAWKLYDNEANTLVIDETGVNNGTCSVNTNTLSTTGKIDLGLDFEASSLDYIDLDSMVIGPTQPRSIDAWINLESIGISQDILTMGMGTDAMVLKVGTDNKVDLGLRRKSPGAWFNVKSTSTIGTGSWHHIVATWDGTDIHMYLDGVYEATTNTGVMSLGESSDFGTFLSKYFTTGSHVDGVMSNINVWNRTLTDGGVSVTATAGGEIAQLYNEGNGIEQTYDFGTAPSVTLTSPANNSNLTLADIDFITAVTDDEGVLNVSLVLDGVINQTNTSGVNGTYVFTKTMSEGVHNWSILAYDNEGLSNQSETWSFNYTQPPIDIQLNNPADAFVSNIPLVNISCSAMDPLGVEVLNLTINGIVNETLLNTSVGENLTLSKEINFSEGIYIWGCQALNLVAYAESSNRTLNITYSSPVISLSEPINNSNITAPEINFTFNATDVNGIANVSLYIDDVLNQTNTSGVDGDYIFSQIFSEGLYNWSIVANSILGKQTTSTTRNFNVTFSTPNITLLYPTDGENITNENISFSFIAQDDNGIANVSFYINGILNETNTSGVNGTYIFNRNLTQDSYNWSVNATSTLGKEGSSGTNSFIVHTGVPTPTITAPNGTLGYFLLGDNETLTYSFTEAGQNLSEHLDYCWYDYPFPNTCYQESVNTTNQTGIDGDCNQDYSGVYDISDCPGNNGIDGDFNTGCSLSSLGVFVANYTKPTGSNLVGASYIIKTTGGSFRDLYCYDGVDYSTEVGELDSFGTQTFDVPIDCLTGDVVSFELIRGEYGLGATLFEESIVWDFSKQLLNCTGTSTDFTYQDGYNNITIFAKDEFGFVGGNTSSWEYGLLEFNKTYNPSTAEGSIETFDMYMSTSLTPIGSNLIYNGTSYSANVLSLGGGYYNISSTIQIPDFPAEINATFYFEVTYLDSTILNSSEDNQSVSVLLLGNCTAYSNLMLNVSLFDEKTLLSIVGTVEADLIVLDSLGVSQLSEAASIFYNSSNFEICSNINLTTVGFLYDLELRYYVDPDNSSNFLYAPEFYHIQKGEVSNLPQEISLYDLNINESAEFTIFYRDDNYIARPNVLLQIQRKYINEGIFRTVEIPITSSEGSSIGHFDLNNYKYKIIVTENGEILNIFNNPTIACQSELSGVCTLTLDGKGNPDQLESIEDILDMSFYYEINDTLITVNYIIPSGETKAVNVVMVQSSPFADDTQICNKTISSSAGSLECTASSTIGDSNVLIYLNADDLIVDTASVYYQEDLGDYFTLNNYAIGALFLILMVTMFVSSPMIMVISAIFSVVVLAFMFLLKGSSIGLVVGSFSWLVIAGIIILIKMNKKVET